MFVPYWCFFASGALVTPPPTHTQIHNSMVNSFFCHTDKDTDFNSVGIISVFIFDATVIGKIARGIMERGGTILTQIWQTSLIFLWSRIQN